MGMTCRVCVNEHRTDIERQIVEGATFRSIASEYHISQASVSHHKNKCLALALNNAAVQRRQIDVQSILTTLLNTSDRAEKLLDTAPVAYAAPIMRTVVAANDTLLKAGVDMKRLDIEQQKLDNARAGRGGDMRAKLADWIRRECPEHMAAFVRDFGES